MRDGAPRIQLGRPIVAGQSLLFAAQAGERQAHLCVRLRAVRIPGDLLCAKLQRPLVAPARQLPEAHPPEYVALQQAHVDERAWKRRGQPEGDALGRLVRGEPVKVAVRRRVDAVVPEPDQDAKVAAQLLVAFEGVVHAVLAQRSHDGLDALKVVRERDEDGQGHAGGVAAGAQLGMAAPHAMPGEGRRRLPPLAVWRQGWCSGMRAALALQRGRTPATAAACVKNPYRGAMCGPFMADGTRDDRFKGVDEDDMAGVAPENRVHVARLRNMSPEELDAIGDAECRERRLRESFGEIP